MIPIKDILETMDYGPSPEGEEHARAWLDKHGKGFHHFIGGRFVPPREGAFFPVFDPAREVLLARAAQGTAADIDAAVKAARKAFPAWAALVPHARARYLYALARLIQKRARLFAVLESMDNGKPIRESRDIDIPLCIRHFYHHAGWAELIADDFPDHRPLGVCGQIIPWNFPLLMLAWKIAPALATGNTVVLKPAEFTPLTALLFAEVCQEAGLPPGVVNIVTGDGETGAALVRHRSVDKIAFTGSTEVGRLIRRATAGTGKKLSLELGGKSPFLVFADADMDAAVEGVVDAVWFNQGQVCCAGTRLLVEEGIAARFYAKLKLRMARLTIGDPLDKSTDIGAIVAPVQRARIETLVAQGEKEGGTLFQPATPLPPRGCFFPPTLFTDVAPAATVAREEIFGPVAAAMTFRTIDEAILLANNTRYGLSASIWSENIDRAFQVAANVKAGVVWINATNLFDAGAPFGGYRESGFGREGGREGLFDYLQPVFAAQRKPAEGKKSAAPDPALFLSATPAEALPAIDRTAKLFIGGKQVRPDSGYSYTVISPKGVRLGEAGLGNRKDIRNAVEAAAKASGWSGLSGHERAQVLYYLAENLSARAEEFSGRLTAMTGVTPEEAEAEVAAALARIFHYAAFADKFDGTVHATKSRHICVSLYEAFGVMGIVCPVEKPLLAFVSLVLPALAMGNRVVVVPSSLHPLAVTDFYQVLETSDVPAGLVNIVTGETAALARTLAEHDEVAALWCFSAPGINAMIEDCAAGNLKSTLTGSRAAQDWLTLAPGEARHYLRAATQVKTIWAPYGE